MKKILGLIVWIVLPYFLVSFVIREYGLTMGFGVMVLICMALFLYFKPQIYYIFGRNKYFKNHEQGFKLLGKAYDTKRLAPQQILIYAYLLLRDGHIDKAERIITGVLHDSSDKLSEKNIQAANLNQAIIRWKRNDIKGAVKLMEELYDKGYRSTVHYGTLGVFYVLVGDYAKAVQFSLEGLDFNPDDISIKDNYGIALFRNGEIDKAEDVYEELFERGTPDFIEAYYNYGLVLEKQGKYDMAADYYQKALGCPEKYLSTVKLEQAEYALSRVEEIIGKGV